MAKKEWKTGKSEWKPELR